MSLFRGSGVAIITPFKDDLSVDYGKLEKFIDFQIDNGTDCIVVCGTTGEASTLSDEEHVEVVKVVVDRTAKRVPVIAGAGSNDTAHGLKLSKNIEKVGADGLLVVTPYYNKTSQKGLYKYYESYAKNVDIPLLMYNVPSRTGLNILPKTAYKLSSIDNIVGIKEASGNISQIAELASLVEGKMDIYSGNDDQVLPILSLGGKGVISVLGNILPKVSHDIVHSYLNGDHAKALKLANKYNKLNNAIFVEVNPIPIKNALNLLGHNIGPVRAPLCEMEEKNLAYLAEAIREVGGIIK